MLRRTPFKSRAPAAFARDPDRVRATPTPSTAFRLGRQVAAPAAPIEKENALQHQGYMDLVRAMPCAHCGRPPRSDFAHRDMGKGQGIKTDCREGFPACRACHDLLGSSGKIPRAERRELEALYGAQTREKVTKAGTWPARLPKWVAPSQ